MMVYQGAAAGQSPTTAGGCPPAAWQPLQGLDAATPPRKRKAETQDNERLSKRLSLLNIEQNGSKLYVPVESPAGGLSAPPPPCRSDNPDDPMRLDDSKHKVYIYDIDQELASSSPSCDGDADGDDGRLVLLPDIEQHLRENRIPPHVLASSDNELAGMQMVLYSDPRSLTVPEECDGVRRAILDARRRVRERQRQERHGASLPESPERIERHTEEQAVADDGDAMDLD